jgi:hypothetical protein
LFTDIANEKASQLTWKIIENLKSIGYSREILISDFVGSLGGNISYQASSLQASNVSSSGNFRLVYSI